jgi:protein TonB
MSKKRYLKYLPAVIGLVLVALVAGGLYLVRDLFQKPVSAKKQIQQITMVQPPPPPPPPPPPEVKPPEPEVQEEKIEEPEPEPEPEQQAEEPPPGEDLGVDAEGGAGSDAFGLVGKKGGHGLIGGGGGNARVWFGQQVQREIGEALHNGLSGEARQHKFSVIAQVWIDPEGAITRAELEGSTGSAEVDADIRAVIARYRIKAKQPADSAGKPYRFRIRS